MIFTAGLRVKVLYTFSRTSSEGTSTSALRLWYLPFELAWEWLIFDRERGTGRNDYIFKQAAVLSYNLVYPCAGVFYIRLIGWLLGLVFAMTYHDFPSDKLWRYPVWRSYQVAKVIMTEPARVKKKTVWRSEGLVSRLKNIWGVMKILFWIN